jgi:selenocysteine-specific elongation factor
MHFIIGTAGHVDHGKTTLIRALTGMETDRLREEKERGLSIVPGFAHLDLPDGRVVGIVDVPGHERFLKNMLSGVTGVDIVMLVIAADEGVMPQTTEHLHILELLKIKRGLVVLTKCDTVDEDWLILAREDIRTRLHDTFLAAAPIVEVAAPHDVGLKELKQELARLCDELSNEAPDSNVQSPFRMAVDRAFSISGFGTVVTGSVAEGAVAVGENLDIWRPDEVQPLPARVRGIEVHGEPAPRAERGQRTAINLAGVELDETLRGGTVAAPATLRAALTIDAWLQVLKDAPRPVKDGLPLRLHIGTAEVGARPVLYEGARLNPAESGYARLRLDAALPCARGDRFVLREVATERVTGGGIILDLEPKAPRLVARAILPQLQNSLEAGNDVALAEVLLHERGAVGLSDEQARLELRRLDMSEVWQALRARNALWNGGSTYLHQSVAKALKDQTKASLSSFHQREPLQAVMPREALRAVLTTALPATVFEALLDEMAGAQQIVAEASGVRLGTHRVLLNEEETRIKDWLVTLAESAAWQPPTLDELISQIPNQQLARKLCFALIQDGTLTRVGDFILSTRRVGEGASIIRDHLQKNPSLSVGEARELLNTTRKWIVPLLEYYDRSGLTKRVGDARVLR